MLLGAREEHPRFPNAGAPEPRGQGDYDKGRRYRGAVCLFWSGAFNTFLFVSFFSVCFSQDFESFFRAFVGNHARQHAVEW